MNATIIVVPCECGSTLYNEIDIRSSPERIECAACGRKTRKRKVYVDQSDSRG